MKKQTNIAVLKELVNNNVTERVELRTRGVQAYNIVEGEEYAVIVAYAKQGGRYYFIDREGRRFLASRYDRAEWLAGEMLEVIANDSAAAMAAADQVERAGSVLVCADLLALFFEECDRRGISVTSTAAGVDDLGRMLTRYDLVKDDNNEAQQDDSNNDTQSDNTNEGDQTTAEPSRLAQVAAKVAGKAKTFAHRAAFFASLVVVCVLSFAVVFAGVSVLASAFDAAGIEGGARFALALCALIPLADVALWVECNAVAVVARLFPRMFVGRRPGFLAPGSFFLNVYRENIA